MPKMTYKVTVGSSSTVIAPDLNKQGVADFTTESGITSPETIIVSGTDSYIDNTYYKGTDYLGGEAWYSVLDDLESVVIYYAGANEWDFIEAPASLNETLYVGEGDETQLLTAEWSKRTGETAPFPPSDLTIVEAPYDVSVSAGEYAVNPANETIYWAINTGIYGSSGPLPTHTLGVETVGNVEWLALNQARNLVISADPDNAIFMAKDSIATNNEGVYFDGSKARDYGNYMGKVSGIAESSDATITVEV